MSKTLRVTLSLTLDGRPIPGFDPVVRTLSVDEIQPYLPYEKSDNADTTTFNAVPTGEIGTIQALLIVPDRAVKVRLDGQSDAGIELGSSGLLLILGSTIDASSTTNVTMNNNSGATAAIEGFGAGT